MPTYTSVTVLVATVSVFPLVIFAKNNSKTKAVYFKVLLKKDLNCSYAWYTLLLRRMSVAPLSVNTFNMNNKINYMKQKNHFFLYGKGFKLNLD